MVYSVEFNVETNNSWSSEIVILSWFIDADDEKTAKDRVFELIERDSDMQQQILEKIQSVYEPAEVHPLYPVIDNKMTITEFLRREYTYPIYVEIKKVVYGAMYVRYEGHSE